MTLQPLKPPTLNPRRMRLIDKHGPPRCLIEQLSQHVVRRRVPWYLGFVLVVSVLMQVALGPGLKG